MRNLTQKINYYFWIYQNKTCDKNVTHSISNKISNILYTNNNQFKYSLSANIKRK